METQHGLFALIGTWLGPTARRRLIRRRVFCPPTDPSFLLPSISVVSAPLGISVHGVAPKNCALETPQTIAPQMYSTDLLHLPIDLPTYIPTYSITYLPSYTNLPMHLLTYPSDLLPTCSTPTNLVPFV